MRFAALLAVLLAPGSAAQRWSVQYFYDHEREVLQFTAMAFPSAERGVAAGVIVDELNPRRQEPVALLTSDGGMHWMRTRLEQKPVSLFFLNETVGWMVTEGGLWFTEEAGRSWQRVRRHEPNSIARVWFLDRLRGFAVGPHKAALETRDGGASWTPIAEAAKPAGNPQYTGYTHIAFADARRGLIVGSSVPPAPGSARPAPGEFPEAAARRRLGPTLTLELQTLDGGATWTSSTAPLFGQVASLKLGDTDGLILFVYNQAFEWPSEVYRVDLRNGRSVTSFREREVRVGDVALYGGPRAFLAGVATPAGLQEPLAPARVRIFASTDYAQWTEMPVDYRAVARQVMLAGPDAQHLWLATDTGMILRLEP